MMKNNLLSILLAILSLLADAASANDFQHVKDGIIELREVDKMKEENQPPILFETQHKKDYCLIKIVPDIIYWNEDKNFNVTVGEELSILIPSVLYDVFVSSDSVVLNFGRYNNCFLYYGYTNYDPVFEPNNYVYDNMIATGYWETDYLFPIENGVLSKLEMTAQMKEYFKEINRTSMIMEDYPDEFFYGMSVENIDRFFIKNHEEQLKVDYEAKEHFNPSTCIMWEKLTHSYFIEGTQMRVHLAK